MTTDQLQFNVTRLSRKRDAGPTFILSRYAKTLISHDKMNKLIREQSKIYITIKLFLWNNKKHREGFIVFFLPLIKPRSRSIYKGVPLCSFGRKRPRNVQHLQMKCKESEFHINNQIKCSEEV